MPHRSSLPKVSSSDTLPQTLDTKRPLDSHGPKIDSSSPERRSKEVSKSGRKGEWTGIISIGGLLLSVTSLVLFLARHPTSYAILRQPFSKRHWYGSGAVDATKQLPAIPGRFSLIDPDTPQSALHYTTRRDGSKWNLIFSDEFNLDNRTFYSGDDPYWEASELYYWATYDKEYYDPSAIITQGGALRIKMTQEVTYGLPYKSGQLQGWNKFCFTGGYVEFNVSLPGSSSIPGLWPAGWLMGNLARAGYGASSDGLWPYTYNACDLGTLANQTLNGQPAAALTGGDPSVGGALSWQSGQRLSACTCPNDPNHPGPKKSDGSYVARSGPEIDVFEGMVGSSYGGTVSQSVQVAPFDAGYNWTDVSPNLDIYNTSGTNVNSYHGAKYQESVSAVTKTDQTAYEQSGGGYITFGMEYQPGESGYITWFMNGVATWTVEASAFGPKSDVEISQRTIAEEPMYLILNLGMAGGYGSISKNLVFPATMSVDYVRVYQDPSNTNIGCDPASHPTEAYINANLATYMNANLTNFANGDASSFNGTKPKNSLVDSC